MDIQMVSWNVNGLRAALNKGFMDFFNEVSADIFCIQETKMQEGQAEFSPAGYGQYWNSAEKKGYSGTAVFIKDTLKPLKVTRDIGIEEHDKEGRVITAEFDNLYLVNVYTPNSQKELARLSYRMTWEKDFQAYLLELNEKKPVVVCGDMNVAHQEIDLKNPKTNKKSAGFTQEERDQMTNLLNAGFTDSFRFLYPDQTGAYTWWSYIRNARSTNAGWRIDYFLVSSKLRGNISQAIIYNEVLGSDHCPIGLRLSL